MAKIKRKFNPEFGNKAHSQGDYRGLPGAVPDRSSPLYDGFCKYHNETNERLAKKRSEKFLKGDGYLGVVDYAFTEEELAEKSKEYARHAKMLKDHGVTDEF